MSISPVGPGPALLAQSRGLLGPRVGRALGRRVCERLLCAECLLGVLGAPSPRVRLPGFSQRLQMITNSVRPQENSGIWDGKLIFFHFNQHFHDNSL